MRDFGDFDEWQATCLSTGRGIADEHFVSPAHHHSRARYSPRALIRFRRACTGDAARTTKSARRRTAKYTRRACGVYTTPGRYPILSQSAPSTQDQMERYTVSTFRMAVLLT